MKSSFADNMTRRVTFRHNGCLFNFEAKMPVRKGVSGFVISSGAKVFIFFHFAMSGSCLIALVNSASGVFIVRPLVAVKIQGFG